MTAEDFVRLVRVFLQAKNARCGTLPTNHYHYEERPDNIYEVLINASPDFSFMIASEPGHCVLRVEKGVVEHYNYSPEFTERLKRDIALDLLGDAAG